MARVQAWLDGRLTKFISRKLLVFGLSTYFLHIDKINGDQWVALGLAYIGIQGITDIAATWKWGK